MGQCKEVFKQKIVCGLMFLAFATTSGAVWALGQEEGTNTASGGTERAVPESEPGFWRKSFQPVQFFTNLKLDAKRFNDVDAIARRSNATQANLVTYAQAGITLSDSACTGWLQTLAYSERDTNFFKDILNIVGNVIMGIAGVNGASPASLAKGTLGLAAGNATIEAYQNEVILGTISDIQAKLEEGRRTSAAYFVEHVPDNYDETKRRLAEYHGSCSPGAVKTLLKKSLAAVKYVAPDTTLNEPMAKMKSDILVAQLSQKIFSPGNAVPLSDDVLYKLYISKILLPGSSAAFVVAAQSDMFVKFISGKFNASDNDQVTLLQTIADIRGYNAKAQQEMKKEADKAAAQQVHDATKEVVAAQDAKKDAVDDVGVKTTNVKTQRDATANAMPTLADKARDSSISDAEIVSLAKAAAKTPTEKEAAKKIETAVNEKETANGKVADLEQKINTKKTILANAHNLQSIVKASAQEVRKPTPPSISAILVPAN